MRFLAFAYALLCTVGVRAESGPDNGTDYVKVLFVDAQFEVNRSVALVEKSHLASLSLSEDLRGWLSQGERFAQLKRYLKVLDLEFQTAPCSDGTGREATICFFREPQPRVVISLDGNRMTTRNQAMAMLVHEAGHLVGEKDHALLDRLGVELVAALGNPSVVIVDRENTENALNIFVAKAACDDGSSAQAQRARHAAMAGIEEECGMRGLSCDPEKARFIYEGRIPWEPGVGYKMEVVCRVRAVLKLR